MHTVVPLVEKTRQELINKHVFSFNLSVPFIYMIIYDDYTLLIPNRCHGSELK